MKQFWFKPTILGLALAASFPVFAQTSSTLSDVEVRGTRTVKKLGTERVQRRHLDRQLVQDSRDLVRYDTAVDVVESGRTGTNGYATRGVDKDRVAIVVDGLEQAESRSSEGFQDIFGAYGNFYANRNAIELENVSSAVLNKGGDSLLNGSGALGGAVIFKTKSPQDFVSAKNRLHAGIKAGYLSRSKERFYSTTLAGHWKGLDALFVFTDRYGQETANHSAEEEFAEDKVNPDLIGRREKGIFRGTPDPQKIHRKSSLFRVGYAPNEDHYISALYEDFREDRHTRELSNLFSAFSGDQERRRQDVSARQRKGLEYEGYTERAYWPWHHIKLNLDHQTIRQTALTIDAPVFSESNPITRNSTADLKLRPIVQDTLQFKLEADKHFDLHEKFQWELYYGLGLSRFENTSTNLERHVLVLDTSVDAANPSTNNILLDAKRSTQYAYLNNVFHVGNALKVGAGLRYDRIQLETLSGGLYSSNMVSTEHIIEKGTTNRFSALSYALSADYQINPAITLQGKLSSGFRAPTADESWFYFPHPEFYVLSNKDLKPERSHNAELGVHLHGKAGHVKLSGFYSRYRDFIDFTYKGVSRIRDLIVGNDNYLSVPVWQNVNLSSAYIAGWELAAQWQLSDFGLPKGLQANARATYTQGYGIYQDADGKTHRYAMNAIQPFNAVLGLGYAHPDNRWSLTGNFSFIAAKNSKDTIRSFSDPEQPYPYVKHSRSVWLFDLIGHVNLGKHVTVRGGVFNLFNQKYHTWNALRSIREFGAVNRVESCRNDQGKLDHANCAHRGIGRFTAPGRNFTLTLEARY